MTDDTRELTRRRLLGAAGAAAAGSSAVGPAGASHSELERFVCITADVQSYQEACPRLTEGPIFESDTHGTAIDHCVNDEGVEMVLFEPEPSFGQPFGWVPRSFLFECEPFQTTADAANH